MKLKSLYTVIFLLTCTSQIGLAQNALYIPPVLTGTTFNLNVQQGTTVFYDSIATPTFGVNGVWMAPTIIANKGDSITLNVINDLTVKTTMHWHGLHVAAHNDGGPHQAILPATTWSPSFKLRNNAATFWYHPHGENQTEQQVMKGIAGFFIIKDSAEAALDLPRTYGVDDIPLNFQTRSFDVLKQIAIADPMDTGIFVNGTLKPFFDAPEQVIRFRLLNGSSLRSFNFGLSNGQTFYQIATDGGIKDTSLALTRLILSPGERTEILIDFSGMMGQSIYLKSYASEMPTGIYGADTVGFGIDTIPGYSQNPLNGADYNLLQFNVVAQTASPVTTLPNNLIPYLPFDINSATNFRTIVFDTIRLLPLDQPNLSEGPFGMNNATFDMDVINEVVHINTTEIWTLENKTLVAHPFHIHDVQFNVIESGGQAVKPTDHGWKDVVLVMPNDSVKFITRFTDFASDSVPYMYHCHLLHHEDDGMMGTFTVIDTAATNSITPIKNNIFNIVAYPNPSNSFWTIKGNAENKIMKATLYNTLGVAIAHPIAKQNNNSFKMNINNQNLASGIYILKISTETSSQTIRLLKK